MISNQLKRQKYSSVPGTRLETEPCCVCQEEYNDGEDLGTLECGHDFHADCIKQWSDIERLRLGIFLSELVLIKQCSWWMMTQMFEALGT
ncbi:hypothetical protein Gorai_006976 [Gossypium raimondii]|uniref:RING-type E3 ubiquitin transferase n=1 Tax=Gossypium raimondii TaxID=29730 RepID=A0A7J8Q6I8_GOSRA|nr:hypothetical protein [Gossypium raimondii]